jgi:hypothetical protein
MIKQCRFEIQQQKKFSHTIQVTTWVAQIQENKYLGTWNPNSYNINSSRPYIHEVFFFFDSVCQFIQINNYFKPYMYTRFFFEIFNSYYD